MKIEKVRVLKTLKLGSTVFQEGKVLSKPIPPEILRELSAKTGTLEVVEVPVPVERPQIETPPSQKEPEPSKENPKARKLVPRGK